MGIFSKKTTTNTASTNNYNDNRTSTVNDAGGGIVGSRNQWDQSVSMMDGSDNSTNYSDSSTTNSSSWADNSLTDASVRSSSTSSRTDNSLTDASVRSSSTSWSDSSTSNNSSSTVNNVQALDGGAIAAMGASAAAQSETARAITLAGLAAGQDANRQAVGLAVQAQTDAAGYNAAALDRSFGLAQSSLAQVAKSSADAIGMQRESFGQLLDVSSRLVDQANEQAAAAASTSAAAYSTAADSSTGNRTVILAGLAVVGLAAAFAFMRR
ncbi:hypothetical protein [Pseudaquabacterium rugosum]|uniref:Uncharacterized protein n=1 Tax=Pseudaquabacterium rugosum TaxID=2984194 RepID=A0ABU9BF56_9BURK